MGNLDFSMVVKLFLDVLQSSAVASAGILLIFALSPLLGKRHTVFWRYLLFLCLAFRLALPFDISLSKWAAVIPVSVGMEAEADSQGGADWNKQGAVGLEDMGTDMQEAGSLQGTQNAAQEGKQAPVVEDQPLSGSSSVGHTYRKSLQEGAFLGIDSALQWAALCWAVGAAVYWIWQMGCYGVFLKKVKKTKCFFGNKEHIPIYTSRAVATPMLAGIWKPQILLPAGDYGQEQLGYILEHEFAHYKRKDLWAKLLLDIARTIHWFNPLVAMMERRAVKDIEFLCDSQVVRGFTKEERKRYGRTLLAFAGSARRRCPILCTSELSRNGEALKERFANLFFAHKKKGVLVAALGVGALLSVSLFVAFGASDSKEPEGSGGPAGNAEMASRAKPEDFKPSNPAEEAFLQKARAELFTLTDQEVADTPYGAQMPRLLYISEKRAIIYDNCGVIIYNMKKEKIAQLLNLKAAGLEKPEGGQDAYIEVSEDGGKILFGHVEGADKGLLYDIGEKKLEYADAETFGESRYHQFYERDGREYVCTETGKAAFLAKDCRRTEEGVACHVESLRGLSIVMVDALMGEMVIYELFGEDYAIAHAEENEPFNSLLGYTLGWEELRRIVGKRRLYQDEEGWSYYLEEDDGRESPLWELGKELEPLLLARYKDGVRQVLEDLMSQDTWKECPVLFVGGRIIYKAAATADRDEAENPALVSISMDGSDRRVAEAVQRNAFDGLCEDGGWLYYTKGAKDNTLPKALYRIPSDFSGNPEHVADLPGLLCGVMDGHAFYVASREKGGDILVRNLSTGEEYTHAKTGMYAEACLFFDAREYQAGELEGDERPGYHRMFDYGQGVYTGNDPMYVLGNE